MSYNQLEQMIRYIYCKVKDGGTGGGGIESITSDTPNYLTVDNSDPKNPKLTIPENAFWKVGGNTGFTHSFEYPNSSVQVKTDQYLGTNDNSAVVIKQNSKPIIFMYNGHLRFNIDGESQVNFPMVTDLNGYPLTTESYYEDHTSFAQANSYKTRVFKTEGSNGTNQTFHKEDFLYSSSRPNSGKIIHTNNGRYIINTQYSENAYIYVHNSLYSSFSYLTVIDNNLALPGIPFVDGDPTYNKQIVANNAGIIGYKTINNTNSKSFELLNKEFYVSAETDDYFDITLNVEILVNPWSVNFSKEYGMFITINTNYDSNNDATGQSTMQEKYTILTRGYSGVGVTNGTIRFECTTIRILKSELTSYLNNPSLTNRVILNLDYSTKLTNGDSVDITTFIKLK